MLFNSTEFVFIFLPVVFFIYFLLKVNTGSDTIKVWLIFVSLFFYAWWEIDYLAIILLSIFGNYLISRAINYFKNKHMLVFGLMFNLIPLLYYKYSYFVLNNVSLLSGKDFNFEKVILPLAISFFTFQQIAYLVDVYRSEKTLRYKFIDYFLFVTFFPQLIAGPIVHHYQLIHQFNNKSKIFHDKLGPGFILFCIGLFKKVVIADSLSVYANLAFDTHVASLSLVDAWVGTASYTLQLYFDFSGYADMALGIAMMFNIVLPINFNSPYKSTSIKDFWSRWHITLSHWLRDYIYIPLGGNRNKTTRNVLITFILGGIWHGAGWGFIVWGVIHGVSLVICNLWSRLGVRIPTLISWAITLFVVHVGWVFFRAESLQKSVSVLKSMFFLQENQVSVLSYNAEIVSYNSLILIVLFFLVSVVLPNSNQILKKYLDAPPRSLLINGKLFIFGVMFGLSTVMLLSTEHQEFLYFNF
ncbi:MBOAT family protein [Vibrio amylolyticus]|uniref:MBOAT family O-acyltransferase n=1 Tax=Vibrio amylolyticus TaxID=2847292 RepID=UPI003551478F